MSVISEAIAAELERTAQKIQVQAETASAVRPGDRFVARLKVPATMEMGLEPEGPLDPEVPVPLPKTHTVQKGETLFAIARRHGTTVQKLAEINIASSGGPCPTVRCTTRPSRWTSSAA